MRSLSMSAKLWLLGILATLGLMVIGGVGVFSLSTMSDRVEHDLRSARRDSEIIVTIKSAQSTFLGQIQEWKNILIRGNTQESFEKHSSAFQAKSQKTQTLIKRAIVLMEAQGLPTEQAQELQVTHAQLEESYLEALRSYHRDNPEAGKVVDKLVKGIDRPANQAMERLVDSIDETFSQRTTLQIEEARAANSQVRLTLIILACVGSLTMAGIAFFIRHDLMQVIGGEPTYAAKIVQSIAQGNLTTPILLAPQDQHSLLASMKQMQSALHKIMSSIRQASTTLSQSSQLLATSSHQVSESSLLQSEAASSTAAAIEQMTSSIQSMAESAKATEHLVHDARQYSTHSHQLVSETISEIHQIEKSVHNSTEMLYHLGEHSDRISGIANVIREIADQTNLLALNAAIEAARAGEHGRGFAVVADEVRKLAEKTTASTQEIAAMIQAIQEGTRQAVKEMEQGTAQVSTGVQSASLTGESMEKIEEQAGQMLDAIQDISHALQEQSSASQQVAGNVEHITQMAEENSYAIEQVSASADRLKVVADELQRQVAHFSL